ncbi:MAG TPA: hypothetical protein VJ821_17985 [Anaerolineales bacterium]|nr:hypothetical protein [Anaerolineales bacterium]
MCMICAAIPATAAVGAKLNAEQLKKPVQNRKPVSKITGIAIFVLVIVSAIYHTMSWQG